MSNLINRFVVITALNEAQIEFDAHYWGLGEAKEIIDSLPTVNAIVIPEGATNGDMIKTLFPNGIQINDTPIISYSFGEYRFRFSDEWWNAPYKKEESKDCVDCGNNCDNGCCKKGCIGYCEGRYWKPKGENNA